MHTRKALHGRYQQTIGSNENSGGHGTVFYNQPEKAVRKDNDLNGTGTITEKGLLYCLNGFSDIWECRI